MAVRPHQPYREIDGRVIGHVEKKNLRRTDQQRGLDTRCLCRRAPLEKEIQQIAQRAEPAQDSCDQRPRERAVALGERGKCRVRIDAVKLLIERTMTAQHAIDDFGRDAPGGETGH